MQQNQGSLQEENRFTEHEQAEQDELHSPSRLVRARHSRALQFNLRNVPLVSIRFGQENLNKIILDGNRPGESFDETRFGCEFATLLAFWSSVWLENVSEGEVIGRDL